MVKSMTEEDNKRSIVPNPVEMVKHLNRYVIGQEHAKKTLSVAIYNHYKRVLCNMCGVSPDKSVDNVTIDKSNVLLAGHTGTGKTYTLKQIAKAMGFPCYIGDATKITESGYVGDDVETLVLGLLREADYDIEKAQTGIIVLDEIDKIGRKGENMSITRDVGGEGVQQGLLKIIEGGIVGVPPNGGRKHPEQRLIYVDTTNILFIGMGAFDGLDEIVEHRLGGKTIGFGAKNEKNAANDGNVLSNVLPEDLKKFGLIPELIGRFPVFTYTNDLTCDDMVRILKETDNSLVKQYQKLFLVDGVQLDITDGALRVIAESAIRMKTGARGLRTIMESLLMDATYDMFTESGKTNIVISEEDAAEYCISKSAA